MWRVSEGITHTGVVSFHELAPRLTRIEIDLDVDPGSLIEKAARGMRHIKRAVRADLHRFKAFIEMQEMETGAWRGTIEDGEVVEDHDESYDNDRDYAEVEDIYDIASPEDQEEDDDDDQEPTQRERQSNGASSKAKATSRTRGGSAKKKPAAKSKAKSGSSRSRGGSAKKPASRSRAKKPAAKKR
jgi:hypothetical protein